MMESGIFPSRGEEDQDPYDPESKVRESLYRKGSS